MNEHSLNAPSAVRTDGTRIIVYDYGNARVLIFNGWPTTNLPAADVVIGQPTFTTALSNGGDGMWAGNLAGGSAGDPMPGLHANGTQLAIADSGNNRVLVYNLIPTTSSTGADVILGQPNDHTASALFPPAQASLHGPRNVLVWNTYSLVVSDTGNHRLLIFNAINDPVLNGAPVPDAAIPEGCRDATRRDAIRRG